MVDSKDMFQTFDHCAHCAVYDKTPCSQQKKINIVVRPSYTVEKVFRDVSTQFRYESYDLILQPVSENDDMIYLNDIKSKTLYEVPGFVPQTKNFLILLPHGEWKNSSKKRYEISLGPQQQQQPQIIEKQQPQKQLQMPLQEQSPSKKKHQQQNEEHPQEPQEPQETQPLLQEQQRKTVKVKKLQKTEEHQQEPAENQTPVQEQQRRPVKVKKLQQKEEHQQEPAENQTPVQEQQRKTVKVKKLQQKEELQKDPAENQTSVQEQQRKTVKVKKLQQKEEHQQPPAENQTPTQEQQRKTVKVKKQQQKEEHQQEPAENQPLLQEQTLKNINVKNQKEEPQQELQETQTLVQEQQHQYVKEREEQQHQEESKETQPLLQEQQRKYSLEIAMTVDSDPLSDDDLALGASASPTEPDPLNNTSMLHPRIPSPPSGRPAKGPVIVDSDPLSDDDLALGASASPTEPDPLNNTSMMLPRIPSPSARPAIGPMTEECYEQSSLSAEICNKLKSFPRQISSAGYVGLVNQAMTCYLNSLLQALFMTPEFRNALYRWEFDNDNEAKSIPYQLQKLFLNLQTSKKAAVETTDLTRSFGWDSTEAWQQHDIQELCRVMFDALEHKFKNTKQANLISNLYEGKMIDYVKCLECNTEKTRADTFLDIPLPVRPFGSTVAYGSIEEALRAFVQPETLNGNNQYFCEKCDKKCDAHKGLKFKNFPYILTLHLKRFDFDYQTMNRIKLNDKVTFPQTLNLNTFINATDAQTFGNYNNVHMNGFATAAATNTDDCSTTDSGSAMEEDNSSGIATTANSSQHECDMQEDDEGIDMSTSTDNRTTASVSSASKADSGPYLYELFAIMIHSGSASGGHYYAYIKEFENGEWFCFNDQNVTPITQEDIQKSFGGGSTKAYYSSVYSSSTNAYMLMYRQIDPKRNERCTKTEDFPEYINTLLPKINCEDESRRTRHSEMALESIVKPRVYFYNPKLQKLKVTRVYVSRSFDLKYVLESAYQMLNVEQFAPISRCRLVAYDDEIIQSFEKEGDHSTCPTTDYLLEYRGENDEFEVYEPGGVTLQAYKVNLDTMELDGPHLVYSSSGNESAKKSVAIRMGLKESEVLLATLPGKKAFVATDPNVTPEAQDNFVNTVKKTFKNLTYFFFTVPNTDPDSLEVMCIPPYEPQSADVVDAVLINGDASSEYHRRESPLPPTTTESNSEDSSLSDGDRTLVDTNTGMSSTSHSPQMSSPDESESHEMFHKLDSILVDGSRTTSEEMPAQNLYFFATKIDADPPPSASAALNGNQNDDSDECNRKPPVMYKVIVDSRMKMAQLKRHLEALIRVPGNYFKVSRKYDNSDPIYPSYTLLFLSEGEMLIIELGKILQNDEHKAKVYFIKLSELDNNSGKLPCVCEWIFKQGLLVRDAKKQLVAQLQRIDSKYKTLSVENCRMWVKGGRNPVYFLGDDDKLGNDCRVGISSEFLIQECEDGISPQTSEESFTIFVRRWHPDTLELDKFQEITLEKDTEIRQALASVSDIPEDNVAYSKINSSFPCTNVSLLNINSSMNWFTNPATLDKFPLTTILSGNVVFYKNNTDQPKELTLEERRELNLKEKTRLDRLGSSSTTLYSPRRERALKIHLDLSPKGAAATTNTTSSEGTTASQKTDE